MTRAQALIGSWLGACLGLSLIFDISWWTLGLPTLIFLILLHDGVFRPASPWLLPVTTHGRRDGNKVALSFDDGPDEVVTAQVLDVLAEHEASASFFVIGKHVEANPALTQRIVDEGHELGNHSYAHSRWLNFRGVAAMRSEIEKAVSVLKPYRQSAGARGKALYRPPIGLKNPPLARVVQDMHLRVVAWTVHSRDTRMRDAEKIAARVLRKLQPGDIILMHDGHDLPGKQRPVTVAALRLILAGLRERQLHGVSVTELLDS